MKKILFRILVAVLITAMLASALAGCGRTPTSNFVPPEFVFVPEFVTLPDGVGDIRNVVYSNNKLFFVSMLINEETWESTQKLFSMNIDGTAISELTGFTPLRHPDPNAEGQSYIGSLSVDNAGNLWIFEMGNFYIDKTPDDFTGEDWERWQFFEQLELSRIRKLDGSGAEISSVDIDRLSPPGADHFYVSSVAVDAMGNIYINTVSFSDAGDNNEIVVLSPDGAIRFRIKIDGWIQQLLLMPDGTVAFPEEVQGPDGYSRQLRFIDLNSEGLGESISIPQQAWQLFPGNEDYIVFFQEWNSGINGISAETGESVRLINWIEAGISDGNIENVLVLPDGRILCTNRTWANMGGSSVELIFFTKTPYSELPERIVLTLAAAWLSWELRPAIIEFNRTNQRYRIHVIDYSEFNTDDDWSAGLTRLTTDIIAGNVPDILDLNGLPFHQYVARGLLEDLFPLIDADPAINRSDFVQNVLRVTETDGKLLRLSPSFSINTIIGHPSVVGPNMGWNMDEFNAVLAANPQADMPIGQWLTNINFLTSAVFYNIEEYVNWETGNVYFDTAGFAQLLEFSSRFPDEIDWGNMWDDGMDWVSEEELIMTGRQLMQQSWISGFQQIQSSLRMFGGDIVFKGFPTESRNGNSFNLGTSLAITTSSVDKDGAWEFMRTFLTPDWQRENITWMFPLNQTVFDEMVVEAMTEREVPDWDMPIPRDSAIAMPDMPGMGFDAPLTQAQVNQVLTLIDSITGITDYNQALMEIIQEDATNFFNGRSSAQDTARVIQSRVSRLIAEQR
ncbi:MAG: extracellular solute-binding protein [Oscillospiraceae bacterium]|nr:extracellular solute-binding protein [Oscillospiraceae bacterium]